MVRGEGFERVPGWECLYVNKSKKLFLSIYVDDFKMAGDAQNIAPMWKRLGEKLELEPPVSMDGNVYLGCVQNDFKPSADMVAAKTKMVKELLDNVHAERPAVSSDDLSTANSASRGSSSVNKRG